MQWWKRPYTAIGGLGLGIVMWVLEMADVALPTWLLIIVGLFAFGMVVFGTVPVVVSLYHGIQQVKPRMPFVIVPSGAVKAPQEEVTQEVKLDKLGLVIKAINEAQEITPKGKDVPVYITDANGLTKIFATELKDILDKLQDENILELKSFPKWLLPQIGFSKNILDDRIRARLEPSRNHFAVRLLKDLSKPDKGGSQN